MHLMSRRKTGAPIVGPSTFQRVLYSREKIRKGLYER